MEWLIIVLLGIIIFYLVRLDGRINRLDSAMKSLLFRSKEETAADKPIPVKPVPVQTPEAEAPPVVTKPQPALSDSPIPWPKPVPKSEQPTPSEEKPQPVWASTPAESARQASPFVFEEPQEKGPRVAWEKFVGENLINKLGIAILTIGIGIFVKYAIDQDWINALGRVLIGLAAGAALAGTAHYLRKSYVAFSSVLIGGALAVFYFTIGLAFHQYELLSQTGAFLAMVSITTLGVSLAYSYNRVELAVIAWAGGFFTPFMVAEGDGNPWILFTYILILNGGMLSLAYYKQWRLVYLVAFFSTLILYGFWLIFELSPGRVPVALLFGTLYYVLFVAASIAFQLRTRVLFQGEDFIQLLTLNLVYLSAGLYVFDIGGLDSYKGIFPLALALVNAGLAWDFAQRPHVDRNFVLLLWGLVISLVAMIAPIQLEGNQITLFWSAEAIILLALFRRAKLPILYYGTWILVGLAGFSWLLDAEQDYNQFDLSLEEALWPILNRPFMAGLALISALAGVSYLHKRLETAPALADWSLDLRNRILLGLLLVVCYLVGAFELGYHLFVVELEAPATHLRNMGLLAYTGFWLVGLQAWNRQGRPVWAWATLGLGLVMLSLGSYFSERMLVESLLDATRPTWHFATQYLAVGAMVWASVYALRQSQESSLYKDRFVWLAGLLGLLYVSQQVDFAVLWLDVPQDWQTYYDTETWSHRVIYPLVWGLGSFILIVQGMTRKRRVMRVLGLAVFSLTLLKLFLIDIWDMSAGGRIAAFISLGLLLLVVSFLYQKLKGLVEADEQNPNSSPAVETSPQPEEPGQ